VRLAEETEAASGGRAGAADEAVRMKAERDRVLRLARERRLSSHVAVKRKTSVNTEVRV